MLHITNGDSAENRRDALRLRPIDRWLGGTHLQHGAIWRWDEEKQKLAGDP